MTVREVIVPVVGCTTAALTLPQPLTLEALDRLEQGLADRLAGLRRALAGDAAEPGELEFQSWMQQLHARHQREARQ